MATDFDSLYAGVEQQVAYGECSVRQEFEQMRPLPQRNVSYVSCECGQAKPNRKNWGAPGEVDFTPLLHSELHASLHLCGEANLRKEKR